MNYKIIQADPSTLVPNPWNSNVVSPDNEAKLEESLKRFGVFKPIVARELIDGTLQIIGGQHRAMVAKRLGYNQIPVVNLGIIDDKQAKEISLVDNGRFGEDDSVKLAELLESLGDLSDLAQIVPYTEEDLNSVFVNTSIALDDLNDLDLPMDDELPSLERTIQTHQIMRFKVPIQDVDLIAKEIERTIKEQGLDDSDSLINAGDALVHIMSKELKP